MRMLEQKMEKWAEPHSPPHREFYGIIPNSKIRENYVTIEIHGNFLINNEFTLKVANQASKIGLLLDFISLLANDRSCEIICRNKSLSLIMMALLLGGWKPNSSHRLLSFYFTNPLLQNV